MEIDVLSQSEANEEKKREKEVRDVQKTLPTVKEEKPAVPEVKRPGERLDALMAETSKPKEPAQLMEGNEEPLMSYEDAKLMTPMEDTTETSPITGKTVMEELWEIDDDIIMNYKAERPKPAQASWLRTAISGFVESGINGAKLPAQLSIWGGMLLNKAGTETLGNRMIEWGNEKVNNINYFLNEVNPGVERGSLTYNVTSAIGDVVTAFGIGKASKLISKNIPYTPAQLIVKELGVGKVNIAADQTWLKRAMTSAKMDVVKAFDFGSRAAPFVYMMGRDIGSFTEERIKQYNDNFGRIDWEKLTPDNITKELLATSIYGAGATWMEKKLGLGLIMKNAPKGADISLNAIRSYVLRGGKGVNNIAGRHAILSYLGLSAASEAFTEASQELWQVSQEVFFKLPEKYHKDGKEVFEYRQKEFGETLQRIATSALIGGAIGSASSAIMVQSAKNEFVNVAAPVMEEVYKTTGRNGTVLGAEEAKMWARKDSSELFNKYYGTSAHILAKELQTQQSFATASGNPYAQLNKFILNKINSFMEASKEAGIEVNINDPELEASNSAIEISYMLTNLLSSKGVSVQNWEKDLGIEISRIDNGSVVFDVTWKGDRILSTSGGIGFNTNTYFQQLTDEERASMENWEEVPVERVEETTENKTNEEYKTQDNRTINSQLIITKPNGETVTLQDAQGNIVTNVEEVNNYTKAVERLNQIEEEAIKSISLKDNQAGAFNTSLGAIFINPRASNPTTMLHEFGHMYFENLFATLNNLESFRNTKLGEAAMDLFREIGVKPGQTHLTTRQSELLADLMAARLSGSAVEGLNSKGVHHRKLINSLKYIQGDAKRRAVQGFAKYNKGRFISISPAAKRLLNEVFDIPLDQIKARVDDKGLYNKFYEDASRINSKLPTETLDRVAKGVLAKDFTNLSSEEKGLAGDVLVNFLAEEGDVAGIKEYFKSNIEWDINSLDLSTNRGQLNKFFVESANSIAAREGITPQEVIANDMLYQTISPIAEEVKAVSEEVAKGEDTSVEKLGFFGFCTRLRYASMLGNISTATLTGVSDVSNMLYAKAINLMSGKWKGVENTVSEGVHKEVMDKARDTFLQTMSANQFAFETEDAYNKRVSTARATTGYKVLDKVANVLSWGSVAPTGGIDFLIKTPYGISQGEMRASKLAQTSSMTADEIMLDAQNFVPATEEGRKVREEVQNAMKDIEFMSEGADDTIGSRGTAVFTNMLDKGLETAIPNNKELRGFIRSAILPFNTIATGQAARVINALSLLPKSVYSGMEAMYNAKVNGDGEAFVKYAEGMKPYLRDGISTAILAALLGALLDDEDFMPSYDNATDKQKKVARATNIPFNSIKIGNTWVSIEYAGVLKSAFYMLPSVKKVLNGEPMEAVKDYIKGAVDALADSPAFELVTSGIRDFKEKDLGKALDNYKNSFLPRIVTSVQQLDGKTNYYSPLTGDNTLTPANNAYRFIFGSRVREGTIEQTNALIAARRGVNLVQTIKSTEKYKVLSADKKKEAEKVFNSTYHSLIESYLKYGVPEGDDPAQIKKIVQKLAKKAREEAFRKVGVK